MRAWRLETSGGVTGKASQCAARVKGVRSATPCWGSDAPTGPTRHQRTRGQLDFAVPIEELFARLPGENKSTGKPVDQAPNPAPWLDRRGLVSHFARDRTVDVLG